MFTPGMMMIGIGITGFLVSFIFLIIVLQKPVIVPAYQPDTESSEDQTTELGKETPGEATKTLPFQHGESQNDKAHNKIAETIQLQPIAPSSHAIETESLDDKKTSETQVLPKFIPAKTNQQNDTKILVDKERTHVIETKILTAQREKKI
ncbi:hypothetical protein [Sporolactobacillus vineae]|nr:hypothetical protein [Sporolactobacillus vineae]